MDRTGTISCPHGKKVRYEFFRWMHPDGVVCQTLGSVHYTTVAKSFHPKKSVMDALLSDPAWLITPQGVEALCVWLTEGGKDESASPSDQQRIAEEQYRRVGTLAASPIIIVLGRALRARIPQFRRNLRYVVKTQPGVFSLPFVYGMCGIVVTGPKKYAMMDLSKYHINTSLDNDVNKVREATRALKQSITDQTAALKGQFEGMAS